MQSSKISERSYQVDKEIQATFSMHHDGRKKRIIYMNQLTHVMTLVYRMVVMDDRKIKEVA